LLVLGYSENVARRVSELVPERDNFSCRLAHDFRNHSSGLNSGEALVEALEAVSEFFVIDTDQAQGGGVEVTDLDGIFYNVVAEVVGPSVGNPGLDPASSHPDGEAARVVVPASLGALPIPLAGDASAKLSTPDDQRVFEESTVFEVEIEGGAGLIGIAAAGGEPAG